MVPKFTGQYILNFVTKSVLYAMLSPVIASMWLSASFFLCKGC